MALRDTGETGAVEIVVGQGASLVLGSCLLLVSIFLSVDMLLCSLLPPRLYSIMSELYVLWPVKLERQCRQASGLRKQNLRAPILVLPWGNVSLTFDTWFCD